MTPFSKQFDTAQHDAGRNDRIPADDGTWPNEDEDMDDDFITHMKFECRQGRFI